VVYLPDCDGDWAKLTSEWCNLEAKRAEKESVDTQQNQILDKILQLINKLKILVKPGGCIFFGKLGGDTEQNKKIVYAIQEKDDTLEDCTNKINSLSSEYKDKLGKTLLFRKGMLNILLLGVTSKEIKKKPKRLQQVSAFLKKHKFDYTNKQIFITTVDLLNDDTDYKIEKVHVNDSTTFFVEGLKVNFDTEEFNTKITKKYDIIANDLSSLRVKDENIFLGRLQNKLKHNGMILLLGTFLHTEDYGEKYSNEEIEKTLRYTSDTFEDITIEESVNKKRTTKMYKPFSLMDLRIKAGMTYKDNPPLMCAGLRITDDNLTTFDFGVSTVKVGGMQRRFYTDKVTSKLQKHENEPYILWHPHVKKEQPFFSFKFSDQK